MTDEPAYATLVSLPHVQCGTIHFGGSHFRLPCVIKELSGTRAHLHVFAAKKLPDRFSLRVEAIGLDVACSVLNRGEKTVTVQLDSPVSNRVVGLLPSPERGGLAQEADGNAISVNHQPQLWIVEDDEDDRAMLSQAFRSITPNCSITLFRDGLRFLDYLTDFDPIENSFAPPLTLLDLNMPRMDGRTTLTHLRSDMRFRHLPIIILTTSCSEEDIEATYTLGVTAYITKPSRESELANVVKFVKSYWAAGVRLPAGLGTCSETIAKRPFSKFSHL